MQVNIMYRIFNRLNKHGKFAYYLGYSGTYRSEKEGSIFSYIINELHNNSSYNSNKKIKENDILQLYSYEGNYYGFYIFDGEKFIYINNVLNLNSAFFKSINQKLNIKEGILKIESEELRTLNNKLEAIKNNYKVEAEKTKREISTLKIKLEDIQNKYIEEYKFRLNHERKTTLLTEGIEVLYLYPSGMVGTCKIEKADLGREGLIVIDTATKETVCPLNEDWFISQPIFLSYDDIEYNGGPWKRNFKKCVACNGNGIIGVNFCNQCNGEGLILEKDKSYSDDQQKTL